VLGSWHTFFSTQAEVSAALTGLVFVALSINLKQILSLPGLADRAGEALLLLLLPVRRLGRRPTSGKFPCIWC
jgi:modulator of FtsH protease